MTATDSMRRSGHLLGTNEVVIADSVVTLKEQSILLRWIEDQYQSGKLLDTPSDPGSYCTPFHAVHGSLTRFTNRSARQTASAEQQLIWVPEVDDDGIDPLPEEFWKVRRRIAELLDFVELEEDHYKGSFVSYIRPGTGVHEHRDARLVIGGEEWPIIRCNVLFKRPERGGLPVLESTELDIPDRGMWAFFPTELLHAATPVQGSQFRGLLSFGFLVRFADLWRRRFQVSPAFATQYALGRGHESRRVLLDQLRAAPEAEQLGTERVNLLEFILEASSNFSVEEAATALQRSPPDVWRAVRDFQRSEVIESLSSRALEPMKVLVL